MDNLFTMLFGALNPTAVEGATPQAPAQGFITGDPAIDSRRITWNPADEVMQVKWPDPPKEGFQKRVRDAARPSLPFDDPFPADATDVPQEVKDGTAKSVQATATALAGSNAVEKAYKLLRSSGLSREAAAAVVGNLIWESNGQTTIKPNTVNPFDNVKNSPRHPHSTGIGQWNDRAHLLYAFAEQEGIDLGDWRAALKDGRFHDVKYTKSVIDKIPLETQLRFVVHELGRSERRSLERLKSAGNLFAANEAAIGYHRPAGYTWNSPSRGHGFANRLNLARRVLTMFND